MVISIPIRSWPICTSTRRLEPQHSATISDLSSCFLAVYTSNKPREAHAFKVSPLVGYWNDETQRNFLLVVGIASISSYITPTLIKGTELAKGLELLEAIADLFAAITTP
jgi:hypothetical protein